jgi:hypothetical protein
MKQMRMPVDALLNKRNACQPKWATHDYTRISSPFWILRIWNKWNQFNTILSNYSIQKALNNWNEFYNLLKAVISVQPQTIAPFSTSNGVQFV